MTPMPRCHLPRRTGAFPALLRRAALPLECQPHLQLQAPVVRAFGEDGVA